MKKVLIIVGIVLVVLIVVVQFFLGGIVKTAIETAGPQIAGVPMTVEKVGINPLGGSVNVKALVIGNPEGFKTDSCMELGEFKLDIAMGSLLSDTIVIKRIRIDAPEITYERGLKSSNLGTLLDNLEGEKKPGKEEPAEKPEKKKAAKKVIIEDFQLNNAQVNATFTALGGKKLPVPLPNIHLQDIGKDSGGTSPVEVISEVLNKVVASVGEAATGALKGAGDMAGKALEGATGAAGDALKGAGDTAGKALEGATGAAGDAMKGAGDAAGKALGGASDAAKGAADSLKKGLGGFLKKK